MEIWIWFLQFIMMEDVLWYENNGSQSFTKSTIDASLVSGIIVRVNDLDGDNDMDVIASGTLNDKIFIVV